MTGKIVQKAVVCTAAAAAIAFAWRVEARQDPSAMAGTWKLNVEASTNPNGPPAGRGRSGGGRGRDSFGNSNGNFAGGASGASADATTLSAEEQQRLDITKKLLWTAPEVLGITAAADEVQLAYNPPKGQPFKHSTNNKAAEFPTPIGPIDIKAKWDKAKLHREIETKDAVKVSEDYELSPDGKQLFVTLKTESRVVRNVQTAPIRRVYDRAQ
jgi:hypothetical protein